MLAEHGVELIGADLDAIRTAEDRSRFRAAMEAAGLPVPESVVVTSLDELDGCPVPAVVRPAFTLGGRGGGIARTRDGAARARGARPRRRARSARCSSSARSRAGRSSSSRWSSTPPATASSSARSRTSTRRRAHGRLVDGGAAADARRRRAAAAARRGVRLRARRRRRDGRRQRPVRLRAGDAELALIEMNPRVSRSSALASKATGYPIAKLAALLAVGYTLDELPNDITGTSSAAFEPALDYVAVKAPRFDFEKFPGNARELGTEMRAVGEALGIGRTFPEALLKALEGVEAGDALPEIPGLHPYFAAELESIRAAERELGADGDVAAAKRFGLPDARIARLLGVAEAEVRARRGLPGRLAVDSCAGEFEARTPYYYLSHEQGDGDETAAGAIVVLGSGTNRIGQGIEFDYCCVRAAQAFRRARPRGRARELEPGDGLDRLRHLRPPLPRAGHARARARRRRAGAAARRRRLARRPDAARARRRPGRGGRAAARRPARRDRGRRGPRPLRHPPRGARPARARVGPRRTTAEARELAERARLPGARPALVRARRARMRVAGRRRSSSSTALRSSTASSRARSSSTSTCSATARTAGSRRSSSTSSGPASTRATRPASSPPRRSARPGGGDRALASARSPRGLGARGLLNLQLALHEGELHVLEANPRASRTVPVRREGDGHPARRPRLPAPPRRVARRARGCPSGWSPIAPGRRRRSSRPSGSRARPTAASRCVRPAR